MQYVHADGRRRSVRLGKVSKANAEGVKLKVEQLSACSTTGQPIPRDLALWLRDLDDKLHGKLAASHLVQPRVAATLGPFLDEWITARVDVQKATRETYHRAALHLVQFFGRDCDLRKLDPAGADRWRVWLTGERGLAEATARKSVQIAKQIMKVAMRRGVLDADPFDHLSGGARSNPKRKRYISRETVQRIIDVCPDAEWRLIVALSRFGGLRIPSGLDFLQWAEVDWDKHRFIVHGKGTNGKRRPRAVPIFPDLRPYLEDAWELAEPGAEFVISERRRKHSNLAEPLKRLVAKAGIELYPKPFHNLRASCQTDLAHDWPGYLVASWLGNSEAVAQEHYLQVLDIDFERAAKAVQKAVQYPPANSGKRQQATAVVAEDDRDKAGDYSEMKPVAADCGSDQQGQKQAHRDLNPD
ncbi:MAG: tyrosine-type recombinase/integrase [Planctomycetota bacterium]